MFKNKLKITSNILCFIFLLLLFCLASFFVKVFMRNRHKNVIFVWFNVLNSSCPFGFQVYHSTEVNHYNLQISWNIKSLIVFMAFFIRIEFIGISQLFEKNN